mmetsp:Transcript_34281/g.103296  ORF Transcript_34281/g.103296 Transcript_34281/m.103296 type:complete len:204 (+) Transcript_34281:326-937(+)
MQGLSASQQLLAHRVDERRLESVLGFATVLILALLAFTSPVRLLLQPKEGLDGEGLDDLEDDGHAHHVEDGADQPGQLPVGRGQRDGLGQLRRVLVDELREPRAQGREAVVEVEDDPVFLLIRGALQARVALVEEAAEKVDAECCEEEEQHAQEGEDVPRRLDHAADGADHELEARVLLEFLHDTQEPHEPHDVGIRVQHTLE